MIIYRIQTFFGLYSSHSLAIKRIMIMSKKGTPSTSYVHYYNPSFWNTYFNFQNTYQQNLKNKFKLLSVPDMVLSIFYCSFTASFQDRDCHCHSAHVRRLRLTEVKQPDHCQRTEPRQYQFKACTLKYQVSLINTHILH